MLNKPRLATQTCEHVEEMRKTVNDQIANHAKDWLTLALAGLGITFAPHEWIGGMFLALAGAAFAIKMFPEQDSRELWLVMVGAFLASHITAMACQRWVPDIPVQLPMLMAGYFSRKLARISMKLFGLIENRSDRIVDGILDRTLGPKKGGEE